MPRHQYHRLPVPSTSHLSSCRIVGLKARGVKTDAHVSVNSVVERILAAEAEDAALAGEPLPSPETATSPHLPAPLRQKQGETKSQQLWCVCLSCLLLGVLIMHFEVLLLQQLPTDT